MKDPHAYVYTFVDKVEIKLLILYLLHQAKSIAGQDSLPRQFISDFLMEHIEVNYFDLQECIPPLEEEGFVTIHTHNHKDTLTLTKAGTDGISYFHKMLPVSVRDKIDSVIYDSTRAYKENASVVADYWADNANCYTSGLKIYDDEKLALSLNVSFSDADNAQKLTRKFKEQPERFYQAIIQLCAEAIDECKKEDKEKKKHEAK